MEEKSVKYIQDAVDLMVQGGEDEFPVMGDVLAKMGIATHKQLDALTTEGHLKAIEIDIPSVLIPSKTVKARFYYTEHRVPKLVESMLPKKQSFEVVED